MRTNNLLKDAIKTVIKPIMELFFFKTKSVPRYAQVIFTSGPAI
ncbi:MAG: hypothetical protein ACTSUT_15185 [Promethearchaeota archaeon]